jgi:hypothetical protein
MKWWIPGNVPSSKNGKRWTGKYLISSKTVMKYRKDTTKVYKKLAASFKKELVKYDLPVIISFKFFRGSRHKFDYINPAQTVQDDMVKHGWIEDDNMTYMIPHFEPYEYNQERKYMITIYLLVLLLMLLMIIFIIYYLKLLNGIG